MLLYLRFPSCPMIFYDVQIDLLFNIIHWKKLIQINSCLFGQINKLQTTFHQWEQIPSDTGEHVHLTKELVAGCESIQWQV